MQDTIETTEIEVQPWPDLSIAESQALDAVQVPYENFATHEVLARRALTTVLQARMKWESDTKDIRETWRWIDYVFRANSLRPQVNRSVHVPELLKLHRALIPRLVEAVLGNGGQYFAAKGRDSSDRSRDFAVTAALEYQLEQNNFRSLLAPFFNSLCRYQAGIWKCVWQKRTRKQVYRWRDTQIVDGNEVQTWKVQVKEVVYFEGNKIYPCDPARTIVDTQRWDLNELAYIGDIRHVALHELMNEKDLYQNLDVLEQKRIAGTSMATQVDAVQVARSGLTKSTGNSVQNVPNTTDFVEIMELWCWFNWAEPGRVPDMRQTIITVADGHTVIRLQENFHDDKHLPYALGRFSDNGFTFYDVGLYDPALRLQDELDHFRSTAFDAADLILAPRAFTKGPAADIPNNLFDMPAGFIGKDVGDIVFQPVPNTLEAFPLINATLKTDMEEIVGVSRLQLGQSSSGGENTATETRRVVEESNRRLLGLVKSADDAMTGLLKIMYSNIQQRMSDKLKFRVLNAALAKKLGGMDGELQPDDVQGPVDFEFFGIRRIQQYGLRGTNLLTFLQVSEGLIAENPQLVNPSALLKRVYSAVVGDEIDDDIMRDPEDVTSMNDQADENRMLRAGMRVQVNLLDNDEEHLQKMDAEGMREFATDQSNPETSRRCVLEHYQWHDQQARKKKVQKQAMAQQAQMRMQMEQGGNDAPPAGGLERGQRQTNGDGTGQQISKAGRKAPITQSNNGT